MPPALSNRVEAVRQQAAFLTGATEGWRKADQEERNLLASTIFGSMRVEDVNVKGVTPTSEYTPLLGLSRMWAFVNNVVLAEATGLASPLRTLRTSSCMSSKRPIILCFKTLRRTSTIPQSATANLSPEYPKSGGQMLCNAMPVVRVSDS